MTVSNRPTNAGVPRTSGAPAVRFWSAIALSVAVHGAVIFAVQPLAPADASLPAGPAAARLTAALDGGHASRPTGGVVPAPTAATSAAAPAKPNLLSPTPTPNPLPVVAATQSAGEVVPMGVPQPISARPAAPRTENLREELVRPDATGEVLPDNSGERAVGWAVQPPMATPTTVGLGRAGGTDGTAVEDPTVLAAYRQALIQAALGYKRYPPLARERGWEGIVELSVVVLPRHPTPVLTVSRSSGYALLDEQALEMMSRAVRRLPVPEALQSVRGSFAVPIRFQLGD